MGEGGYLSLVCGAGNASVAARRCIFGKLVHTVSKYAKSFKVILLRGVSEGVVGVFLVQFLARIFLAE